MEKDAFRERARAMWAEGDWDDFSSHVFPVGRAVLERVALEPGMDVLDVGTGSGGTVAIPAAQAGANVVGCDITPELLEHARRRAAEAGVEVEWVEADAQDLPFADASFDRVLSTFGAMFAPDHRRAAAELVRVCRPGGLGAMATWAAEGFAGGFFKLTGSFLPPPPPGVESPLMWGGEEHATAVFEAAGAHPSITRETVVFESPSVERIVGQYERDFGPLVAARRLVEPQGRWPEFLEAFTDLVESFNRSSDGTARIAAEYLLITFRV
jgi:SAM-dependent methyltransferase